MAETRVKTEDSHRPGIHLAGDALLTWAGTSWRILNFNDTYLWLHFEGEGEPRNLVKLLRTDFETLLDAGELVGLPEAAEAELNAEAREILALASPAALQKANERYRLIVEPGLRGQAPLEATVHPRTAQPLPGPVQTSPVSLRVLLRGFD